MPKSDPRVRLDDRFTHLVSCGESMVLVGEDEAILLETPLAGEVVRLLSGRFTAVEIADALADRQPPEVTHFMLLGLERAEIVRHADAAAAYHAYAPQPESAAGDMPDEFARSLRTAWRERRGRKAVRVPIGSFGGGARTAWVTVVLTDDYLHPEVVEAMKEASREPATKVLLACIGVRCIWIGPGYGAGGASCIECLRERLRQNLVGRALIHVRGTSPEEALRIEPLDREIPEEAYWRLAIGLRRLAVGPGQVAHFADALRTIDSSGAVEEVHHLSSLPQCPACGDPTLAPPGGSVSLTSRRKVPMLGGGYRTVTSDETLRRLTPLVSPLTGVVRYVRRVPVAGTDIVHVYTASHARDFGAPSLRAIRSDRRDPAGGKGRTDLDARVSAICESLERYSAGHRGNERCRVARYSELAEQAIHPERLLLISRSQYESRDGWNRKDGVGMQWVPEPYGDEPIEWSPVRSLTSEREWLVPSASVYHGFRGEGRRFCRGDSNGLSGGNHLEEAVLQGLLELVERDAVAIWWYNRARLPALDLASSRDDYIEKVASFYRTLGRSLWALDLTSDLGIPCFASLSAQESAPKQDIIFGFGAHLDPDIALSRALTELNQILPTVLRTTQQRRAQLLPEFAAALHWWDSATLEQHPYLSPADDASARRLDDYPVPSREDLLDDLLDCVARVSEAGCDVLVHDLTRPDVGFPVARVFAPGLRHFWRRLGPGRLYDVPVTLGWLEEAHGENDLNPISMFV